MGVAPRAQKKDLEQVVLARDEKKALDNIFYGSGLLIKQFSLFKDKAKHLKVPDTDLKFYYDNQEVVQLFKPIVTPKSYISITAPRPFARLYLDTMFITPLNITLVNGVDLFSKFGFTKVLRGLSIDSKKASLALETFVKEITDMGYYPESIRTDPGSEFQASFKETCESLAVPLFHLDAGDKLMSSPVESYNRTIRQAIEKVRATLSNQHPVVPQIEKAMKDITSSYNNTPHSNTRLSPFQILKDKDVQLELEVKNALKKDQQLQGLNPLPVGVSVRIAVRVGKFDKLSPNWSKEVYTIAKYDKGKNRYYLEGKHKGYQQHHLQVVDVDNLMRKTISRYVVQGAEQDTERPSRRQRQAQKELSEGVWFGEAGDKRVRKARPIVDL